MKILISAAEASSDAHAAHLVRAIRKQLSEEEQGSLEIFGVGGPKLQAEGFHAVVDARKLLAMGFLEILGRLPMIFRALRDVARTAERERPDVIVVVDYPDFHFRLARRVGQLGIPIIYYIPPKVWAWRKGRIRFLRDRFARILCILPFEEAFYRDREVPVTYVGNPLVDELPLELTQEKARGELGLQESEPVLVLMPGSRPSELKHHLELMLQAALEASRRLREKHFFSRSRPLSVLMPFPTAANLDECRAGVEQWISRTLDAHSLLDIRISEGNAPVCLAAADVGLIKSGTSTLEAAMMRCPHLIIYQSNLLSHLIFSRVIRRSYPGPIGLTNLVHGWKEGAPLLVPEFTDRGLSSKTLARELLTLFEDREQRSRMRAGLETVRKRILGDSPGVSPSELAAKEVLRVARGKKKE